MYISNLAINFGTLADTVELGIAIVMMIGGVFLTYAIQKWADKTSAPQPSAANVGQGGTVQHEKRTLRQ